MHHAHGQIPALDKFLPPGRLGSSEEEGISSGILYVSLGRETQELSIEGDAPRMIQAHMFIENLAHRQK
jgi:hypothetical protein